MERRFVSWVLPLLAVAIVAGCAPRDPQAEILEHRTRWKVDLLSWAAGQEGLVVSLRVSGPPRSKLNQLTVRLDMYDEHEKLVDHEWQTIDLTEVPRGGPRDLLWKLPPRGDAVVGMHINLIEDPTPEEAAHIKELQLS